VRALCTLRMARHAPLAECSLRAVVVIVVICVAFAAVASCDNVDGISAVPKPSRVIFRKGEGCAALATYTAVSNFLANDFNTYMIDRVSLHGVEKPFFEFQYGIPGEEGYKQAAIELHYTKYRTVDQIKEVLHAYNVHPEPDLVRMRDLHAEGQVEMNKHSKAARAFERQIAAIEKEYLLDYDQMDALVDELYYEGLLAHDHNGESPPRPTDEDYDGGEVADDIAVASDGVVHALEQIPPEAKERIVELLLLQEEEKAAVSRIRSKILPWLDSLREPQAEDRLRGVRYKFRLIEKEQQLAARRAVAEANNAAPADEGT